MVELLWTNLDSSSIKILKEKSQVTKAYSEDEVTIATNWTRPFIQLYKEVKWLNSWAILNKMALENGILMVGEKFFKKSDSLVHKCLISHLNSLKLSNLGFLMKLN